MKKSEQTRALAAAVDAARAVGTVLRRNLRSVKRVNSATQRDIKLELDVRCQQLIERKLGAAFPQIPLLGEEGDSGDTSAAYRWVVDPIDGTVNFAHGIPHACVSIALQRRDEGRATKVGRLQRNHGPRPPAYATILGVVYDPFQDELWTATRGGPARLNGRIIRVSRRRELKECLVSLGFSKNRRSIERGLPHFAWLIRRVRKMRMMGAAALGLTYVATGRLDAFIEGGVSLWDVAAAGLIIECAGGKFWSEPLPGKCKLRIIASNGLIHGKLPVPR